MPSKAATAAVCLSVSLWNAGVPGAGEGSVAVRTGTLRVAIASPKPSSAWRRWLAWK